MTQTAQPVLFDADSIARQVAKLGVQISKDCKESSLLTVVVVLKGAFIFAADLIRCLKIPHTVEFVKVRSYSGAKSTGVHSLDLDLNCELSGRDVLLVEDIVDTGQTLGFLHKHIMKAQPRSLKVAAFLVRKESPATLRQQVNYQAFEIADEFAVGYGLDFDQLYRGNRDLVAYDVASR